MRKVSFLKIGYFIIGLIAYLGFSYQAIILLNKMQKIPHYPRVFMSVYKGPTVAISGNIIFKGYEQGFVAVRVVAPDVKGGILTLQNQIVIAAQNLSMPGPYKINVPKKTGKVYIVAANFDTRNISEMSMPGLPPICRGEYAKNPLDIGKQDIGGIDIENTPRDSAI